MFIMAPSLLALKELQVPMPCSDKIWKAEFEQWQEIILPIGRPSGPFNTSCESVCEAIAVVSVQQRVSADLSEAARLAVLLAAFSQHSHIQDLVPTLRTTQANSPYGLLTISLQDGLDNIVQSYIDTDFMAEQEHCRLLEDCTIMARLAAILSFVPTKLLLQFGHWQISSAARENACHQLRSKVHQYGPRARECVHHAAQLFAHFRGQSLLTHVDPFCLLIATLYLWAYIDSALPSSNGENLAAPDSVSGSNNRALVRLDRELSSADRADWKDSGISKRPHITGVGALDTARSHIRLLKEASRIMGAGACSSKLILNMSRALYVQALGYLPITEKDA
jgi:hypothetical protein